MIPATNIILDNSVSGPDNSGAVINGAFTGNWFAFQKDGRTHNIVGINILAGTGTVILEGRIDALSAITTVISVTTSDSELVAAFSQYRIRVSGGTNLSVRATVDRPGRIV